MDYNPAQNNNKIKNVKAVLNSAKNKTVGAVIVALVSNVIVAIAKFVAFLLSGSSSMLSEFFHSLADCTNQILLLIGDKSADKRRNQLHQFGYGKSSYFFSFLVAVFLFFAGGLLSIFEGVHKIISNNHVHNIQISLIVLAIAIITESLSLRTAVKKSGNKKHWIEYVKNSKDSAIVVILLEDSLALVSLCVAFILLLFSLINPIFDGLGAIIIGCILIFASIFLTKETYSLLVGESVEFDYKNTIVNIITTTPNVDNLIYLRTMYLSADELLVCAKITLRENTSMELVATAINDIEYKIDSEFEGKTQIFIEPDLWENNK